MITWTNAADNEQDTETDATYLRLYSRPVGPCLVRVLQFQATAREASWDLQDARGYVYAYGAGTSLQDCQRQAYLKLIAATAALLAQLA